MVVNAKQADSNLEQQQQQSSNLALVFGSGSEVIGGAPAVNGGNRQQTKPKANKGQSNSASGNEVKASTSSAARTSSSSFPEFPDRSVRPSTLSIRLSQRSSKRPSSSSSFSSSLEVDAPSLSKRLRSSNKSS